METKTIVLDKERNVSLTAYLQPVDGAFSYLSRRPSILILPGGGYSAIAEAEADPVAFAYLKAGYQTFILRYGVGVHGVWPAPLEDCDQALRLIRRNADEWGLYPDKVAVAGFSAGGHLAAASATMGEERPDAAILGYAVMGDGVKNSNPTAPNCSGYVDENTSPCFIFAARDDGLVPIENSVEFIDALVRNDISFECHIYSFAGHGFSTADASAHSPAKPRSDRVQDWVDDSIGWLTEVFGAFDGEGGMTEPKVGRHMSADFEPYLSNGCTVGKLLRVPESRAIVVALFRRMAGQEPATEDDLTEEAALTTYASSVDMKFGEMLGFAGVSEEDLAALDGQLRAIRNPAV